MTEDEPERFVELAEEYSEAMSNCFNIKVQAGCLLLAYVSNVDEAAKNVI